MLATFAALCLAPSGELHTEPLYLASPTSTKPYQIIVRRVIYKNLLTYISHRLACDLSSVAGCLHKLLLNVTAEERAEGGGRGIGKRVKESGEKRDGKRDKKRDG